MKADAENKLSVFSDSWSVDSLLENKKHRKFNEVFLVRHKTTGIPGICKRLIKTTQNQHLWPLLRQEASFSFTEKGLPQTLDFEENETEIILIRNFQQGIPLDEYWRKISKKDKTIFILQLVGKLIPVFKVMKQNGIVHCDIKPTNIIVSGDLNELEVSLIDFGMAIQMHNPPERKTLFALGYSAPELILNKLNIVDHATDIFALGISIWHLFAGKLPLMHPNPGIMTNLQITHPLPESRMIPKEIFPVLQKMCVKYSFQRPPNQLENKEVEHLLKSAMENRFQDLEEVFSALNQPRKMNWFQRISRK